jgi:hypothetical protein
MLDAMPTTQARAAAALLGALLSLPSLSSLAAEPKKPKLELRASPLMGPPTTEFTFVAELKGGDDAEAFYCPRLEWRWNDDDDASVNEPECPPFEAGVTKPERRFSTTHRFTNEGSRRVRLTLSKDGKVLGVADVSVRVTWEKKPPRLGVETVR